YALGMSHASVHMTRHTICAGQPTLHRQVLPYLVMRDLSSISTDLAGRLLRLGGSGLAVGQPLQQAPDGPGRPKFYDGGMMGRRAQDTQGGLHVYLPTGDRIQKNRVAAKEALPPGLLVRVAFP